MQSTNNIFLIKPANAAFNKETADSNSFQSELKVSDETILEKVHKEFDNFHSTLKSKGINVFVFEDTQEPKKPDAIFPNNWVTFHPDGTVILYPMLSQQRRNERRKDIIESLKQNFRINSILDLSSYEKQNRFLEGTGSIVFDHVNKIAYACLSPRTDKELFIKVCEKLKYKPVHFYAHNKNKKEIYHTNVMMCVAEKFVVICLNSITDEEERQTVINSFEKTNHEIIDIGFKHMNQFAGNMLELKTPENKSVLVMSQSAYDVLNKKQKTAIENFTAIVPLNIKTIETIGGGSARCMIAEIFLEKY